jgi:hypothetical protein
MTRLVAVLGLGVAAGCRPTAPPPAAADLPPAYPRATITDPKVAAAAKAFTAWAADQQANGQQVFARVEVLPPVPTLLPYGIGTYQKEPRLPAVLTTGPGWDALPADRREATAAASFTDLANRLTAANLKPTVTVQTREGLELAWINELPPGRKLLHGDGD